MLSCCKNIFMILQFQNGMRDLTPDNLKVTRGGARSREVAWAHAARGHKLKLVSPTRLRRLSLNSGIDTRDSIPLLQAASGGSGIQARYLPAMLWRPAAQAPLYV
jgi:hypothetical protein